MQTVTCDVCRKKVENSLTGRSIFYYAEHSVCEACKDNLEGQVRPAIRNRDPFSYDWYAKFVGDSLVKSISKGK
jgi:hypothetical protein